MSTERQTARAVLMVRPEQFGANPETASSNFFQSVEANESGVAERARRGFDTLALRLAAAEVRVHQFAGTRAAVLPDEVFPNNWLSLHADGTAVLYPLLAPNRRLERRRELLEALERAHGYRLERVVDLTALEQRGAFLEGTGSLVLDRPRRIAYACLSPRTHSEALAEFGRALHYEIVAFEAADRHGRAIYHTNVMLALGSTFAAVCADAIAPHDRRRVLDRLSATGREIIDLTFEQLHAFAGNLLELETRAGGRVIALSAAARTALEPANAKRLAAHGELVSAEIGAIEKHGGGSVRCMLCEVHLPHRDQEPGERSPPA